MIEILNDLENKLVIDLSTLEPDDNEYTKDGILYCKKCHGKRSCKGLTSIVRCNCSCLDDAYEKRQAMEKARDKQRYVDGIRKTSLLGDRYKDVNFDNSEKISKEFEIALARCRKYCDNNYKVLKSGVGIYLYGDIGTGKSWLTACIANDLMGRYYTVLFTNLGEISKYIRSTFERSSPDSEYRFLHRLSSVSFLIIDDIGTEQVSRHGDDLWLQEKLFEIVNARYNQRKPIIFTSNYSLEELGNKRGVQQKTLERIAEVCEPIKLTGKSYRLTVASKRETLF